MLELFIELGANDQQIDFPIVYASARSGIAGHNLTDDMKNMQPVFETVVKHVPAPKGDPDAPLQIMVTSLDYDDYIGRLAIGRIKQGTLKSSGQIAYGASLETLKTGRISHLFRFEGLKRTQSDLASVGDILCLAGIPQISLGDTITDKDNPMMLPGLTIDEPTLAMTFQVSDSPNAGKEGKYVTSRQLGDRLRKEGERNPSMRLSPGDTTDTFEVCGRGELHLSILLETMRREGYELAVSSPRVLMRRIDGELMEPMENLTLDIPEESMGAVMERMGERRAEMQNMTGSGTGRVRLEFLIPMRGLIGFRSELLTQTRGYGIMSHLSAGFGPYKGELAPRNRGVLIASEAGPVTSYALLNLQDRGVFFVDPGEEVYMGQIVGENCRPGDLEVNICKKKAVNNIRTSNAEETVKLNVPRRMSMEQALEYIADDELVEITPTKIRMRKALLSPHDRNRVRKQREKEAEAATVKG